MDERLLTLVQISDLHIGDDPQGSLQPTPALLALSSVFEGWLDHHRQAMTDFYDIWTDILNDRIGENVGIILSGDLTSNGALKQFTLASEFLGAPVSGGPLGLSLNIIGWNKQTILGNHDQWPGSYRILGPSNLQPNPFVPHDFPIVSPLSQLEKNNKLRVILVDSDADVDPYLWDRAFGRGRFETQMRKLDHRLPAIEKGEIRVMVIHHAVADDDVPVSVRPVPFPRRSLATQWKKLKIEGYSLREMETRLVEAEVSVVLTGHLHSPRLTEMTAVSAGRSRRIFEARCGTTTQQDDDAIRARMSNWAWRPTLEPNSFLLHEILERDGRLVWATQVHWRSDSDGFKCITGATPYGPAILRHEFLL